jgi:hypothetical protein
VVLKNKIFNFLLCGKASEPPITLEHHQFRLSVRFFFVAEGERITLIAFAIIYIFMLKGNNFRLLEIIFSGWNADFYTLEGYVGEHGFSTVLYFYLYMLLIEWTGSTIITIIIR